MIIREKVRKVCFFIRALFLLISVTFSPSYCHSNDSTFYFYHGNPYGSEAIFNPLTVILNGGFGILQISNRSNYIGDLDLHTGLKNVTHNLSHPLRAILKFGWKNFLRQEVIPMSIKPRNAQYFPNYTLHMIGGGFTYRAFLDWYRWHGFSHTKLWAIMSWFTYNFVNEIVENNDFVGPNVDPIADIYIFNTLGIFLFSFNRVADFFGNTLQMRDWSFMPGYDPWLNTIENIGQSFVSKIRLPFFKPWSCIIHWGVHGMLGPSYQRADSSSFSAAFGLVAKDLVEIENENDARLHTATLVWTLGFFYDRKNSLLASLILSGTKGYKVRLNVYPGLIHIGKISPGFFISLREDNQAVMGIHLKFFPFGLARRTR